MTCIVVTKLSKNKCIAASDRRLSITEDEYTTDPNPKVRKIYDMLVGGAGSAAPTEIFMMIRALENVSKAENVLQFLTMTIAPAWKRDLKKAGLLTSDTPDDEDLDAEVFIALKGEVYSLSISRKGSIHVLECSLPCGFGCGGGLALAAFKALTQTKGAEFDIKQNLTKALEITASMNSACDDNIDLIKE